MTKVRGIKSYVAFINKTLIQDIKIMMMKKQLFVELRQIGRWSAEMILLFTYRSNIWPSRYWLLRAISTTIKTTYHL